MGSSKICYFTSFGVILRQRNLENSGRQRKGEKCHRNKCGMCLKVYSSTDLLFFKVTCFCQVTLAFRCALSISAIRQSQNRLKQLDSDHLMTLGSNDSSDCTEYCIVENDGRCCVDAISPTGEGTGLVGSIDSCSIWCGSHSAGDVHQ